MPKRRQVFICIGCLFLITGVIFATRLVRPTKANAMVSFIGYTNAGQQRLAFFSVTNLGTDSISLRYVIFLQPKHTDPVRIEGGPSLHVGPRHLDVFCVTAPQSPRRWQLAVGFVRETSLLKCSRWYHTKCAGSWLDRLVPRLKEGPIIEVLSEQIEY